MMPMIKSQVRLQGIFQLTVRDIVTGKITKQTKPFENLITNSGLDYIFIGFPGTFSVSQAFQGAYVGTGTATPAFTDTTMTSYLAGVNSGIGLNSPMSNWVYVAGTPPYWTSTGSWTFPAGTATGTLAEVGIGGYISTAPNYILQSHALIVDGAGTPTTITVLSTEALTLTYTLNLYWDTTTHTGTISISGVTYNISWLPQSINSPAGTPGNNAIGFSFRLTGYNGSLGTYLSNPTGANGTNNDAGSTGSYTIGTYYQDVTYTCDINHLNFTGGITVLTVSTNYHKFQIGFTPAIPKDNTKSFTFVNRVAVARYP